MPAYANPVVWFEIPVTDMARAKQFYETVFSIEITEMDMGPAKMGWLPREMGSGGATGTLILREGHTPSLQGCLIYIHVDAIDPTLELINKSGGHTIAAKSNIGQHGFVAQFADTEGNRIALHEKPAE